MAVWKPTVEEKHAEKLIGYGVVPPRSLEFPGETTRGFLRPCHFFFTSYRDSHPFTRSGEGACAVKGHLIRLLSRRG